MFNDIQLGEKSSGKSYKQYDLNNAKNVCLHNMEGSWKGIKVLMVESPYGRITDDFICMYMCVSFSIFSKFLKIILILSEKIFK